MSDYGVFKDIVANAGSLMATVTAIALGFKGRAKWEPSEQDINKGPQRVAGVVSAVFIAVLWAFRDSENKYFLATGALGSGFLTVLTLCAYGYLISLCTYYREIVNGNHVNKENIIGGFFLTKAANQMIQNAKKTNSSPRTIQELFKGSAYDPDLVWTRPSRAFAKQLFVISYLGLTVCGTVALASASILIGHSLNK